MQGLAAGSQAGMDRNGKGPRVMGKAQTVSATRSNVQAGSQNSIWTKTWRDHSATRERLKGLIDGHLKNNCIYSLLQCANFLTPHNAQIIFKFPPIIP